jgi:hypothetical protein
MIPFGWIFLATSFRKYSLSVANPLLLPAHRATIYSFLFLAESGVVQGPKRISTIEGPAPFLSDN